MLFGVGVFGCGWFGFVVWGYGFVVCCFGFACCICGCGGFGVL